jgi:hypothetical protein
MEIIKNTHSRTFSSERNFEIICKSPLPFIRILFKIISCPPSCINFYLIIGDFSDVESISSKRVLKWYHSSMGATDLKGYGNIFFIISFGRTFLLKLYVIKSPLPILRNFIIS